MRSLSPARAVSPAVSSATANLATLLCCRQTPLPAAHLSAMRRLPRKTPSAATTSPSKARGGAKSTRRSAPATGTGYGTATLSATTTGTGDGPRFAPAPLPRARVAMVHPLRARHARAAWQNARRATKASTSAARLVRHVRRLLVLLQEHATVLVRVVFKLSRVIPALVFTNQEPPVTIWGALRALAKHIVLQVRPMCAVPLLVLPPKHHVHR
jgi:hypothetical protein